MPKTYKYFLSLCIGLFLVVYDGAAQFRKNSTTRAVIIGISDYEDPSIPDLKYAHKDALAFKNFLTTKAAGSVPLENIRLLTNEKATCGNVHKALNWLTQETQKNDHAFIYFSGHGDVESIDEKEEGHLLVQNTSASIYQLCSVKIEQLRKIVSIITIDKEARAIVITDACRSGALAGESIDGAQATASAMYKQFSNEIKIMSCQPNEYSHESERWQSGAFTHFLIYGMMGLADQNNDDLVNLGELGRYLETSIAEDVKPAEQNPVITGDKKVRLSFKDEERLSNLENPLSVTTDMGASSTKNKVTLSGQFNQALGLQNFIPEDSDKTSALEIYQEMQGDPNMKPFLRGIKGDLISALQDNVQKSIKAYLRSDNKELAERFDNNGSKYSLYPKYMRTAAELLGQEHYLYRQLKAKELYFEAVLLRLEADKKKNISLYELAMENIQNALFYEERAAYIYNELALILRRLGDDSCEDLYRIAMKISPTWAMPYSNLSYHLLKKERYDEAEELSLKALEHQSELAQAYYNLASIASFRGDKKNELKYEILGLEKRPTKYNYLTVASLQYETGQYEQAISNIQKSMDLDSTIGYNYFLLSDIYMTTDNYDAVVNTLEKAKKILSTEDFPYIKLGWYYYEQKHFKKAEKEYLQAIQIDAKNENSRMNYGILLLYWDRLEEAKFQFREVTDNINASNSWAHYYLADIFAQQSQPEAAIMHLTKSVEYGFNEYETVKEEKSFDSIRSNKDFLSILQLIESKKGND